MSVSDKIDIVHRVLIQNETHASTAKEHRVSALVVGKLMKKARQNPRFIEEMVSEREGKTILDTILSQVIQGLNDEHVVIDNIQQVKEHIAKKFEFGARVKTKLIREVMKNRLGMSFHKIQPTAVHLNSVKNLVLRQQFSLQCLEIFR